MAKVSKNSGEFCPVLHENSTTQMATCPMALKVIFKLQLLLRKPLIVGELIYKHWFIQ